LEAEGCDVFGEALQIMEGHLEDTLGAAICLVFLQESLNVVLRSASVNHR